MARKGEVSILLRIRDGGSAAIAATQTKLKKFAADVKGYFTSVNGALATLTAGLTVASISAFVVRSTMEFQRFSAQLRIFSGSAEKASAVMNDLKRLAMDLPFDLAQITEAFITLRSGGVDPSEKTFRRLGDIASGMGKDISTLAQAVKNGLMGEMEMLKQFGFSMLVEGDQLRASFGNTTKLIGRDAASILGFLEEIAEKEFAGAAAARMQTLEGAFSNLQDKAWNLAVTIGERGGVAEMIAEMAGGMSDLADAIERNESSVIKWTRVLVESLQLVGSVVWTALVVPFDAVVGTVAKSLEAILRLGAGAMQVMNGLARAMGALVGDNSIIRGLKDLTDPSFLQGAADSVSGFADARFQGGAGQVGALAGRAADWWMALTTTPGMAVGGVGLNGGEENEEEKKKRRLAALAAYQAEQLEIAKTLIAREKLAEDRAQRDREASAAVATGMGTEAEGRLTRRIGSNVVNNAGLPTAEQWKAMNDEITASIEAMQLLDVETPSVLDKISAGLQQAALDARTLEENLVSVGQNGLLEMTSGMASAFAQISEGWDEVGRSMQGAIAGAVANMAAAMSRYYALQAAAAFGEGIKDPLLAGAKFAAAARLFAASAGFAALSGVLSSGGNRGGSGAGAGGGRGSVTGARTGLDDVGGAPVTLVLNGDRFDLNNPRTQDELRAMLERLSGRAVVIRPR